MQPAPSGAWEAVTKVALPQGEEYEQAGLIVHQSDADFAKLVLMDIPNVGWRVEFGQNIGGGAVFDEALDRSGALPANVNVDGLWLKVVNDGSFLTGHWSADGTTWNRLGRARSVASLPSPSVGLAAYNGNGQAATFDFFHIDESDVEPACQEPATPEAGYRMLYDGTRREPGRVAHVGPRRLLAPARLLDPLVRRTRPAVASGAAARLQPQARLEDGRGRQRGRLRRVPGPGR